MLGQNTMVEHFSYRVGTLCMSEQHFIGTHFMSGRNTFVAMAISQELYVVNEESIVLLASVIF
jgi:hypothetical protein